jgi:hypothetical protein
MTDEELAAIEARANAATSTGLAERGPWASLADIPALVAEVRRLRSIIENAREVLGYAEEP